jgi:hypothetical protein
MRLLESELVQKLANKSISKTDLYNSIINNFSLLPQVITGVSSSKATIRYGCGKVLMDLSMNYPEKLYDYMDEFVSLLDSKYRILIWNAMAVIANLSVVDKAKKFDAIFNKYYSFLNNEYLVTVANTVGNSGKIALAKPYLIPQITNELLKVENISATLHLTDECKKVIAEATIQSFNLFFSQMGDAEKIKVLSFVKRHANSSRTKLKLEAKKFLKRWSY